MSKAQAIRIAELEEQLCRVLSAGLKQQKEIARLTAAVETWRVEAATHRRDKDKLRQELADYQANVSESMDRTTAYEAELKADRDHWRKLCQDGWIEVADGPVSNQLRENLAAWMMAHGFVTGHGDSHTDLLSELGPQVDKLRDSITTWRVEAETYKRDCAALRARAEAAEKDAERLKRGLQFYADGDHFQNDGAFDTVSGEPQNFWCDQEGSMVEDGTLAKKFLEGWNTDENDEWVIPVINAARGRA